MPQAPDHREKQRRNTTVKDHLNAQLPNYEEWILTAAFYIFIHIIDEFLARHNRHPKNHLERKQLFYHLINRGFVQDRSLKAKYEEFYTASVVARYDRIGDFQRQYVRPNRVGSILQYVNDFTQALL